MRINIGEMALGEERARLGTATRGHARRPASEVMLPWLPYYGANCGSTTRRAHAGARRGLERMREP